MLRVGSAAGLVAVLWLNHELPPSESLDCPSAVLGVVCEVSYMRELERRRQGQKQRDDEQFGRMHDVLHGGS